MKILLITLVLNYAWIASKTSESNVHLFHNSKQIGSYDLEDRKYYQLLPNDVWKVVECPVATPDPACKCGCDCCKKFCLCRFNGKPCTSTCQCDKGVPNYGIDYESWTKDTKPKTEVENDPVLEDGNLLRLSVIGPLDKREQVRKDLETHPTLAPWKDKVQFTSYDPNHFLIKDKGYVTTGSPTIYLMRPDGKVVAREDSYRGPDALAEAIRKADPNYKPALDPSFAPSLLPFKIPDLTPFLPLLVIVVLLYIFSRNKDG